MTTPTGLTWHVSHSPERNRTVITFREEATGIQRVYPVVDYIDLSSEDQTAQDVRASLELVFFEDRNTFIAERQREQMQQSSPQPQVHKALTE